MLSANPALESLILWQVQLPAFQVPKSVPVFPSKNGFAWVGPDSITYSWWRRLHPGLDPIYGTFLVGDVCLINFNPFLGFKPDISIHLQASKHSGYVFLCWISWICGGTGNCGLFVATCFSWETWLGMVKTELCLGAIWPPNASFSVRNSAGFGGFIFWHSVNRCPWFYQQELPDLACKSGRFWIGVFCMRCVQDLCSSAAWLMLSNKNDARKWWRKARSHSASPCRLAWGLQGWNRLFKSLLAEG